MKDTFDQQGYVIVRELVSRSDLDTLTKIVDRIYAQWLNEHRADFLMRGLVNMHSLTDPQYFAGYEVERMLLFEILASDNLTTLVNGMFGDDIYFHNTQLFFNPFEKTTLPYWHRDLQYSPMEDSTLQREIHNMISLHVRIPLVHEIGVELIPGTHQRWDTELERNVRLERGGHNNSEDLPGSMLIELMPGDVLIFSANMIHRGRYDLNNCRKALDLCIGKPHPLTSKYLDDRVLPHADEVDRIPNNRWFKIARVIAKKNKN